jgi:hypothetical protein
MMDLIPFLNMRKLVLGTSKSINPRHIFTCNLWCLICLHEQPFFVISLNSLSFTCVCNILWWIGNWDLARKGNGIADKNFKMHWSPMTLRSHAMKRIEVMNDQMIGSSSPLDNHSAMSTGLQDQSKTNNDSSAWICFKSENII